MTKNTSFNFASTTTDMSLDGVTMWKHCVCYSSILTGQYCQYTCIRSWIQQDLSCMLSYKKASL